MHDRTSKALGTVETSNHSYQAKAPVKATRTKMNGTFLLKCLAAFCMLGNVTASPTPTCGCSEAISALRVEFQAKYDKQQALIDYVANEVQDVRECSACVSPSPPPPSPSPPPPSPSPLSPSRPPRPAAYPGDLNAWYCPGAFDIASGTWQDCTGNGNTAALSGSGLAESRSAGHGATSEVLALSGTTSSEIAFGAVIKSEFTVCSVTRYTGGAKERILQGSSNWFHGHWGYAHHPGMAGVAFYDGFKTAQQNNVSPNTNWVVMCGSNAGSQLKLVNGVDLGTAAGGTGGQSLFVNAGAHPAEKSDFAIAELVVWPRGLTDEEMRRASNHLIDRLGLRPAAYPPSTPPPLPPSPSPPPPADCDCDFHAGGCSISEAAPEGKACKCVYKGAWTCGGDVVSCGNPASPKCAAPDKSVASCTMGGGDCGGYSDSQDCDCDYNYKRGLFGVPLASGCKISQAAPKHTACECSYKGAFTCDGEVVQCRNDWDPLCLNPDLSKTSCNLAAGSDCDGY